MVAPSNPVTAGSWQSFTLVYTAGRFGIDDSGSIKVCFRFATDQTKLQLDDPAAPGFVSVEASNGAVLETRFDLKQNVRPYDRTLHIKVLRGFMREGDTITVRLGDRRRGSPGLRVQTFSEPYFEFMVLSDPIACYRFTPVAEQPWVAIEAGSRASWTATLPTLVVAGEPVTLRLRSDDGWGNPTGVGAAVIGLVAEGPLLGLPPSLFLADGEMVGELGDLVPSQPGEVSVELRAEGGAVLARSNPMRVVERAPERRVYWADFHAQSGETIGTNAAVDYFSFARDAAFLDVVGHQGNDFQITAEFWAELNRLYDRFDEPGCFVTVPGYEWSGNTALGGDRNVFFRTTGRPIRRSSHALTPNHDDLASDCHTAADLFAALRRDGEDAITFAHVGGRYADIALAHDPAIETAVEVHSSWGTFEWLANDAFALGHRVGIVANSDGHKGRPGAESPGASLFGAYGGLTALVMPDLSRGAVFDALRARRHYATTGSRPFLDLRVSLEGGDAIVFERDPALGATAYLPVERAMMGDIVHAPSAASATIDIDLSCSAPIERVEIRNGAETVVAHRPYGTRDLGRRIRVIWSGAEYRGRFRLTSWDGTATLTGNAFERSEPINFLNKDRTLVREGDNALSWRSITTGNFSGFDASLRHADAGSMVLDTAQGRVELPVSDIGYAPRSFAFGGLDRKLQVRAHRRGRAGSRLRRAVRRREPGGRRRQSRHGGGRARRPGRLYARGRDQRPARDQCRAVPQAAVRSREGLHADHADGRELQRANRPECEPGPHRRRTDRVREITAGRPELLVRRSRHDASPLGGALRLQSRAGRGSRPLQGRGRRRERRHDQRGGVRLLQPAERRATRQGGAAARPRRDGIRPLAPAACRPDHDRGWRQGL